MDISPKKCFFQIIFSRGCVSMGLTVQHQWRFRQAARTEAIRMKTAGRVGLAELQRSVRQVQPIPFMPPPISPVKQVSILPSGAGSHPLWNKPE